MSARRFILGAILAASLVMSVSHAQAPAPSAAPDAPGVLTPSAETPLGSGPYKAVMEMENSLPGKTFYRPADISKLGDQKLPIIAWGNGACANTGNAFRGFLSEIASYGYLVIALGPIDPRVPLVEAPRSGGAGPAAGPRAGGAPRVLPPPATKSSQLIEAMDWATGQPAQSSKYQGKLDTKRVAVMGQSCGGVQTIEAAVDPRVTTAVIWNSGMPINGTSMAGGAPLTKADTLKMHAPTMYITGDESDQAWPNANDDFAKLTKIPVFRAWERGVPHGGTYRQPNGGEFGGIAVAWLNWQLKGDAKAAQMFRGANCGLCVNPRWVVQSKNIK